MRRCRALTRLSVSALIGFVVLSSAADRAWARAPGEVEPAPPLEEARTRYASGIKLYEDGAFEAARVELERAYTLAPTYKLLYNIGLVYEQLSDFVTARERFQKYMEQGGLLIPDSRRAEVTAEIAKLSARIGYVEIEVNVPDAQVFIDDRLAGKSPLPSAVAVNPGTRRISAVKNGSKSDVRAVEIAGSDRAKVSLVVASRTPTEPKLADAPKPRVSIPWVGWAATAVLGTTAGIFGYSSVRAHTKLEDDKNSFGSTRDALNRDQQNLRVYSVVADVSTVLALAAGVYSLYLTIKWNSGSSVEQPPQAASLPLLVTPGGVRGTF